MLGEGWVEKPQHEAMYTVCGCIVQYMKFLIFKTACRFLYCTSLKLCILDLAVVPSVPPHGSSHFSTCIQQRASLKDNYVHFICYKNNRQQIFFYRNKYLFFCFFCFFSSLPKKLWILLRFNQWKTKSLVKRNFFFFFCFFLIWFHVSKGQTSLSHIVHKEERDGGTPVWKIPSDCLKQPSSTLVWFLEWKKWLPVQSTNGIHAMGAEWDRYECL